MVAASSASISNQIRPHNHKSLRLLSQPLISILHFLNSFVTSIQHFDNTYRTIISDRIHNQCYDIYVKNFTMAISIKRILNELQAIVSIRTVEIEG